MLDYTYWSLTSSDLGPEAKFKFDIAIVSMASEANKGQGIPMIFMIV